MGMNGISMNSEAAPSEESDYENDSDYKNDSDQGEGYSITIHVLPDGFKVDGGELLPDLTSVLKTIIKTVNETPQPESEQAGFDSVADADSLQKGITGAKKQGPQLT